MPDMKENTYSYYEFLVCFITKARYLFIEKYQESNTISILFVLFNVKGSAALGQPIFIGSSKTCNYKIIFLVPS